MKRRYLLILPILLLASGCFSNNKKLICSTEEEYDGIPTSITITTRFKKGKAANSIGKAVMTFESEEEAKAYLDASEDKSSIKQNGNRLTVISEKDLTEDDAGATRNEIKALFEANNYKCK